MAATNMAVITVQTRLKWFNIFRAFIMVPIAIPPSLINTLVLTAMIRNNHPGAVDLPEN